MPTGAEAVLLNQDRTYPDLFLPIGQEETQLFEAIDGRHTIAQIMEFLPAEARNSKICSRAKVFFEQLWWYDQVVFDSFGRNLPGGY